MSDDGRTPNYRRIATMQLIVYYEWRVVFSLIIVPALVSSY